MSLLGKPAPPKPVMKTVAPSPTPSSALANSTRLSIGIPLPSFLVFYHPAFPSAMSKARSRHEKPATFPIRRLVPRLDRGTGKRMPEMLLHWSPRSPFVRKVMIAAHECGLADRIYTVRTVVAAATPNIELMKENPQSRLPTLRLADGTVVYDSAVICEYFDTLHSGVKLFPEKFPERLIALRRQSLGDGMLDTPQI